MYPLFSRSSLIYKIFTSSFLVSVVWAGLVLPASAANKKEEAPDWYEVEVLIFTHDSFATGSNEQWGNEFNPSYPNNLVILRQPLTEDDLKLADQTSQSANATNAIEEQTQSDVGPGNESGIELNGFPFIIKSLETTETDTQEEESKPARRYPTDLLRDPFFLLPSKDLNLNSVKRRIAADPYRKTVFHNAWRQPGLPRGIAQPVLIQGGEQFGLHFQLEGMLSFAQNRFLHIDADLFLSDYSQKIIKSQLDWSGFNKPSTFLDTSRNDNDLSWGGSPQSQTVSDSDKVQGFELDPITTAAEDPWTRNQSVHLTQSSRVKTDKLLYLDHPLFGVIVKVTPYDRPPHEIDPFDLDNLPQEKAFGMELFTAPEEGLSLEPDQETTPQN